MKTPDTNSTQPPVVAFGKRAEAGGERRTTLKGASVAAARSANHVAATNPFSKILESLKLARDQAQALLDQVIAGTAPLETGVDRGRAVDVLNGTIEDCNRAMRRITANRLD